MEKRGKKKHSWDNSISLMQKWLYCQTWKREQAVCSCVFGGCGEIGLWLWQTFRGAFGWRNDKERRRWQAWGDRPGIGPTEQHINAVFNIIAGVLIEWDFKKKKEKQGKKQKKPHSLEKFPLWTNKLQILQCQHNTTVLVISSNWLLLNYYPPTAISSCAITVGYKICLAAGAAQSSLTKSHVSAEEHGNWTINMQN